MKTRILYALAAIVVAIGMASCEGGGGKSGIKNIQFKRMHLDGVNTLALATVGSSNAARMPQAKLDTTYNVQKPVYSVSEDGTLVEITYTIDARGNDGELVDMVKAHMRLAVKNIFAIGDEWLWLYDCHYDYPDLDKLQEPYHSMIKEIVEKNYCNFLVRRSDGALFYWDGRDGRPWYNSRGVTFERQSDIYGVVECLKGEIYSNCWLTDAKMLYRLKDQGDELAVTTMLASTMYTTDIMPDTRGALGLHIWYHDRGNMTPGVLFPDGPKDNNIVALNNTAIDARLQNNENVTVNIISVDNTIYAVYGRDDIGSYFYSIELSESPSPTAKAKELIAHTTDHLYIKVGDPVVSKQKTMSFMEYGYKYTFDPQAKKITRATLPNHYPSNINAYYDDIAYVMRDDEKAFFICDLAKNVAEEVMIDFSALDNDGTINRSSMRKFGDYNPATQSFTTTAYTMTGKAVTVIVDVAGNNKGKARVIKSGDTTAGTVISVMLRLN
ncbi:MAG: hypothetical protein IJR42_04070 [Paludibacteraceae bacterium]|nr:hypothetical protein [Paludibacteraceae bacterium]